MKIYRIILSPQHKCCSTSATACQVGLRKTANAADETAATAVCSKCADSGHRAPSGGAGWWCRGCHHVLPSLFAQIGLHCLYIPSGNRVDSSCPWIFIDGECGICRVFLSISLCERAGGSFVGLEQGHMVTAATVRLSEAALAKRQGPRVALLQRHSMWS